MIGFQKPGWFGKLLEENIQKLQNGDYSSIPWIFCTLAEDHNHSKLIAAKALNDVLASLQFDDVIRIDTQMRQTTSMEWSIDWRKLNIDSLFTQNMNPALRRAVIVFASFNPNGFLRERAVQIMGSLENTLSFIILRQNDWVAQVRLAAEKSFNARIMCLAPHELLDALPFAEKIKGSKHSESTQVFFDYLTSLEHRKDLLAGLHSPHIRTRRLCIHALLDSANYDANLIRKHISYESDPFLRKVIFERLCTLGENVYELAQIFLRDKYPLNRILALQYLYTHNPLDQTVIYRAVDFLLDKNAMVRALAQKIVGDSKSEFNIATFYRGHLEDATVAAILGIGETGQPSDCMKIEIYLCNNQASVISAVITTLMRLNTEQYSEKVIDLLDHPSSSVVKTAQRLIIKYGIKDYSRIQSVFDSTSFIHSKIKCASLLFAAPKWQSIIYILQALSDEHKQVQEMSIQAIYKWLDSFNRSYYQATTQQKERTKQLITELQGQLPVSLVRELIFVSK